MEAATLIHKPKNMGYRSTLISEDYPIRLPEWFTEKYTHKLNIRSTLISSKYEFKIYDNDLFNDYQKALVESGFFTRYITEMNVVVMGDDGFVSKVILKEDAITYLREHEWHDADAVHTGY